MSNMCAKWCINDAPFYTLYARLCTIMYHSTTFGPLWTIWFTGAKKTIWVFPDDNPIRPALLQLLHLPTLTHLQVTRIWDFVVSDLIPCVNLKYLNIGNYTTVAAENLNTFPATLPEHSIQLNEFVARPRTSTAIMKLCTARRPDGQPIIDFGSLSKITVTFERPNEGEASQELFRRCHSLTNVSISCKWHLQVHGDHQIF